MPINGWSAMPYKKAILPLIVLFLLPAAFAVAQDQSDSDSLVRLDYGKTAELIEINGQSVRKVIGPAQFMHNNTYMLCDTALWNIDTQIIDAIGNVSLIQEGTVLTSESMVYYIDDNLAQFRGHLVQLEDSDHNTLRTSYLDYNTKDSVAVFDRGGSMRDKDGQIIESIKGTYDSKIKLFTFKDDVNMFTDSIFVKTTYLEYESAIAKATFGRGTNAWKEDNMLSADAGWYDRANEVFFFRNNVHVMNETQEGWSDTLYFYRNSMDVDMRGKVQVTDTSRNVTGVAGRMIYVDTLSQVTMVRDPAVIGRLEQDSGVDSVYFRADTIIYCTKRMCDVDSMVVVSSRNRVAELDVDPVGSYRAQAAEAARKAAEEAMKNDPNYRPPEEENASEEEEESPQEESVKPKEERPKEESIKPEEAESPKSGEESPKPNEERPKPEDAAADGKNIDKPAVEADSLAVGLDSLAVKADSVAAGPDSTGAGVDSLAVGLDSLAAGADSVAVGLDSLAERTDLLVVGLDSLAAGADSLAFGLDLLAAGVDSLAVGLDSIPAEPLDTTKVGFISASHNVRVYKKDMQVVCDSLEYCDLDSLVRLYRDVLIWNEVTQQYSADSVITVFKNGMMQKANLMSEAYIVIEEDPDHFYNQIKSIEAIAYFDSTGVLSRFDALGSATGAFFLREQDVVATANKTDSKMLSAVFVEGNIDKVYYFDDVKSDAYPVVQLPREEQTFKGFNWAPERRPADRYAVTTAELRPAMRGKYRSVPRAMFTQTELYFPGYIPGIYGEIAARDSLERVMAVQRRKMREFAEQQMEDSLARAEVLALVDSVTVIDTTAFSDSLALADSLSRSDLAALKESLADKDSLETSSDSLAVKDSLAALGKAAEEKILTKEELKEIARVEREKARAEREAQRQAKLEEKEAKWARLDSLDAAKVAAKQAKKLEKERAKKRKYLEKMDVKNAKEEAVLEQYVRKIELQEDRRAAKGKPSKVEPPAKAAKSPKPPRTKPSKVKKGSAPPPDDSAAPPEDSSAEPDDSSELPEDSSATPDYSAAPPESTDSDVSDSPPEETTESISDENPEVSSEDNPEISPGESPEVSSEENTEGTPEENPEVQSEVTAADAAAAAEEEGETGPDTKNPPPDEAGDL